MTYDPYQEAGLRRDLPKTDPQMVAPEETRATIWLPVAIAIALFIGLGYYFYGHTWNANPRCARTAARSRSQQPSPN